MGSGRPKAGGAESSKVCGTGYSRLMARRTKTSSAADDATTHPFPNGSEWVRADFDLHTKADKESACGTNCKAGDASLAEILRPARLQWFWRWKNEAWSADRKVKRFCFGY